MRLDRGAMPMCVEFERNGMRISKDHLRSVRVKCTGGMESLAAKVTDLTGEEINIGSADQLAHLLFKVLKLKQNGREKWTKSRKRLAADSDVLKAMVSQHACIKPILDWKEREKIRSTYTDSLIAQADENDRIHTDVSLITTGTQRLASSNPNLQNIPIRTALGQEIRNAFIPSPGNKIGSVDASQIEMRMNAVDSQCENLIQCFWSWEDVYWQTAELTNHRIYTNEERASKELCRGPNHDRTYKDWDRFNAKTTALMVAYDSSAAGLYDQFLSYGIPGYTEDLCQKAINEYFSTNAYHELLIRRKEHHRRAFKFMRVWDMWGFTRWIPQVKSVHKRIVNEGLRQAGNLAGQGGAAGIIKLWMAVIWDRYVAYWKKHGILLLMQVHDEIVAEGPGQTLVDFFEECVHFLRNLLPYDFFNVPLEAGYGIGDSWGVAEH